MILEQIAQCFSLKNPFVAYRKPNEEIISMLFQEDDTLHFVANFEENGFVFAPFDDAQETILIPFIASNFIEEELVLGDLVLSEKVISKTSEPQNHIDLVSDGIKSITSGVCEKIVLSRKEIVTISNFDVIQTFKNLLHKYPTAFVYVWYHPKVGLWMGATPETLVELKGRDFKTMSLAGTQEYVGNTTVTWGSKELEEQEIVTDYILDKISPFCDSVEKHPLKTIRAGNLLHLQTSITGSFNSSMSSLIKELHPTPAVCGFPKEIAKDFILTNENYEREFYTGFLGELNFSKVQNSKETSLFVNLRCMKIEQDVISIYVGGGVNKDSNSKKEFEETVAKSKTMLSVL